MKKGLALAALAACLAAPGRTRAALPCEGTCMAAGSAAAPAGAGDVPVEVSGTCLEPIRGFAFAVGHDASRLRLEDIDPGPLFAGAELVSVTIKNEPSELSEPFGALFVILDFSTPLDQLPLDFTAGGALASLVYSVRPEAPPGATPLLLHNRTFGRPRVSIIYVNAENHDVEPALSDGLVMVTASEVRLDSVTPGSGPVSGGTEVTLEGVGFPPPPDVRVFFGVAEATVQEVTGSVRLTALSPASSRPGRVDVRVETPFGGAVLEDAFEYLGLFVRGNCNGDADVDISDSIYELAYLFTGGPGPGCEDACDTNDDGSVDISDAVSSLDYLFRGGPPPRAPYPAAGEDPTADGLGCDEGD